jgi:hypothetical protein
MAQASSFSRRIFSPELCQRQSQQQTSEPDLRQMAPAVAAGCHHDHAPQAKKEPSKKRKAERRKTQSVTSAACAAARALQGAHAFRRSTAALA